MSTAGAQGAVSGAAQGAATGAVFGVPGIIFGGVVGGISGLISGNSASASQANSMAWADYNRQSQYNVDMYNIQTGLSIAGLNAAMAMSAAKYNASNVLASATYNAQMIGEATAYNIDLLENEEVQIWQDLDLDINQIEMFRARERSNMVVDQAASGTLIGQDSNGDVIASQMAQEALDLNVIQFGAERQAAGISNQMAQSKWEGEVAIQQTMWEGQMQADSIIYNAKVQSAGSLLGAAVQAEANMYSAKQAYVTGGYNIQQSNYQFDQQQQQNMVSGLFSASATYAGYKYATKIPGSTTTTTGAGSSYLSPYIAKPRATIPQYIAKPSSPGTSLLI